MALRHGVYDSDTHFIINPFTRVMRNDGSSKTTLIQNDHNSERFTFEVPRYIEGHDMSLCNVIQVHYNNIDVVTKAQSQGAYDVCDMQISPTDENVVIFSWLISQNATRYVGTLNFLIRFSCTEDNIVNYVWNTAIYTNISVSNGIYNGDVVVEEYADVLEQWRTDLFDIADHFARGVVEGETFVIENVTKPTENELARGLEDGSFVVAKAELAHKAEDADLADMALHDNAGRPINDYYMRWEDFNQLELDPMGKIFTTMPITTGWKGRVSLGQLPKNRDLDKIVTIVVGITNQKDNTLWRFVGIKTSDKKSDANGDYVEFYCTQQDVGYSETTKLSVLRFGSLGVRLYQTQGDLFLVYMDGGDCVEIHIDDFRDQTEVQKIYHHFVTDPDYYLTSIRYWFA